jgi:ankyrin repeat protein
MSFWKEGGLTQLAEVGDLDGVRRLLNAGVPVDFIENGRFSDSPLQVACRNGHLNIAKLLLERGANVCFSPVTAAGGARQWEVLGLLAENGGDFQCRDATGRSGVDYLRRCRSPRIRAEIEGILAKRTSPL